MPESAGDEPICLHFEDALELYAAIIDGTPAQAADHLRNRPGLEGALARPATYAHYAGTTAEELGERIRAALTPARRR